MMPSARFPDLEDASVLITGGGSGIGAALTEGFALQGAKVAFIDIAEAPSHALVDRVAKAAAHAPLYLKADLQRHRRAAGCDRQRRIRAWADHRADQQRRLRRTP